MIRQFLHIAFLVIIIGGPQVMFAQDDELNVFQDQTKPDSVRYDAGLDWALIQVEPEKVKEALQICLEIKEATKGSEELRGRYLSALRLEIKLKSQQTGIDEIDDLIAELEKAKASKKDHEVAYWARSIAHHYQIRDDFPKAMEYYVVAIEFYERTGQFKKMGFIKQNLNWIYGQLDKKEESLREGLSALEVYKSINDTTAIIDMTARLGEQYALYDQMEKSDSLLRIAEELAEDYGNKGWINFVAMNRAEFLRKSGKFQEAIDLLQEGLDYHLKFDHRPRPVSFMYAVIADNLMSLGKVDLAIAKARKGLEVADQHELIKEATDNLTVLHKAYVEKGDWKNAFLTFQREYEQDQNVKGGDKTSAVVGELNKFKARQKAYADSLDQVQRDKIQQLDQERQLAEKRQERFIWIGGAVLMLLIVLLMFREFQRRKRSNLILGEKKTIVEEQKKEIVDSIEYAKRIQNAILPPIEEIQKCFTDSFVLYEPKDIVAGDFYWLEVSSNEERGTSNSKGNLASRNSSLATILIAAADCTGHGVPGAMVSVVCNNALNRSVREFGLRDPGLILDKTKEIVVQEFEKGTAFSDNKGEEIKDGMDIALVSLEQQQQQEEGDSVALNSCSKLKYAGAHNPLWVIRKGQNEIEEIKASKQPVGKHHLEKPFDSHQVDLFPGDQFYLFSDGYADQFGGDKGKKFKSSNFKKVLLSIRDLPMAEQKERLLQVFLDWKGDFEQLDDICVIGVRV